MADNIKPRTNRMIEIEENRQQSKIDTNKAKFKF